MFTPPSNSPIVMTVQITPDQLPMLEADLASRPPPDAVRLVVYILQSPDKDCAYFYEGMQLQCRPLRVFAMNRLRNLAIASVQTTHFVVFDMDVWPSSESPSTGEHGGGRGGGGRWLVWWLWWWWWSREALASPAPREEGLHEELMKLKPTLLNNPYAAVIVPTVFTDKDRINNCGTFRQCVEG